MRKFKLENKQGLNMREYMLATNCKDAIAEFDIEVCGKPRKAVIRIVGYDPKRPTYYRDKLNRELIKYIADYYNCDTDWEVLGKLYDVKTVPIILWYDCGSGEAGLTKWTTNKVHMAGMTNYMLKLAGYPEQCKPYKAKNEKQKRRVKDLSTSPATA